MKPIKKGMTEAVTRDGRSVKQLTAFDLSENAFIFCGVIGSTLHQWYMDGSYTSAFHNSQIDIFAPPEFEYQWLVKHKNDILYDTTNHYKNEEDALAEWEDYTIVYLIHESRRECQ